MTQLVLGFSSNWFSLSVLSAFSLSVLSWFSFSVLSSFSHSVLSWFSLLVLSQFLFPALSWFLFPVLSWFSFSALNLVDHPHMYLHRDTLYPCEYMSLLFKSPSADKMCSNNLITLDYFLIFNQWTACKKVRWNSAKR